MVSNVPTGSLISKRVNGKPIDCCSYYPLSNPIFPRYSNMDFALLSTLLPSTKAGIMRVLVSYDIGCQWGKNLQSRISQYSISSSFSLNSLCYWKVVVPKFHLSGHGE